MMADDGSSTIESNAFGSRQVTCAQAVVECMVQEGVEFVFGIPGGQLLGLLDALYDVPAIQFVATHHECAAACMADGYARVTGRPGICVGTTGPGATNLLTGIGGALRDSSPVIAITANNRRADMNRDDAQSANHVAIFQTLTKKSTLVVEPRAVPATMREAFRVALSGCPGPVHIDFAREILDSGQCEITTLHPSEYRSLAGPAGCETSIREAIEILGSSHRPAIWAGRGVLLSGAGTELVALAESLRAPVVTTYNGISCVPNDHPLVFGPRSRHGTRLSNQVLSEADAVLVVGNSLNGISTDRWSMSLPRSMIQIDIEPETIGRDYPNRVGIVGDATQVLSRMNSLCTGQLADAESALRDDWLDSLAKRRDEWQKSVRRPEYEKHRPVKPQFVMTALRRSFPRDAIFAFDAGNPGIWSHLMPFYEPRTYMKPVGFGNMGFALPAAIAAKLAMPRRTVVAVVGDGSLGMCLAELETAVRLGAQLTVVVLNDSGYGNIKQEQFVKSGPRYTGVDFGEIHYDAAAKALGADGVRVTSPERLISVLEHAKTCSKAFLVDVQIDTQDNVWLSPF